MKRRPRIVTVTANTAIDRLVEVDELILGTTTRAKDTAVYPAGKGICVSIGVAAFGMETIALAFVGEETRGVFKRLELQGIDCRFHYVPGETRSNITVFDRHTASETHIQTAGYSILESDLTTLMSLLDSSIEPDDIVIIAGSIPCGVPDRFVGELVQFCKGKNTRVILDSSGQALRAGVSAKPDIVKPNLKELRDLLGDVSIETDSDMLRAALNVSRLGPSIVVISGGPRGVWAYDKTSHIGWRGRIDVGDSYRTAAVGSGDALVAGLAATLAAGNSLQEALRTGVACGAANLATRAPGNFLLLDVQRLANDVIITECELKDVEQTQSTFY